MTPVLPETPLDRLRWTAADGLTMIGRRLTHIRHAPGELIGALIFPIIMILLFGYIFGSAIQVPGGGDYREYLMPGLFAMATFSGVMANVMMVAADVSRGVMDRFRSMPIARWAVPFGQSGADLLISVLTTSMMVVCGLAVGWRAHEGLGNTVAAFALILLMRLALGWAGIWIGLAVKDEQTADAFMPLIFPITMVSNTFVPTDGMPAWLRVISEWNPVSALVAALRDLFGNPGAATGTAWPVQHPIAACLGWTAVLLVVFVPLSIRAYTRKGR
ncbi:ABC transporter permease [Actinocorallia longicatena]|uniref:Transport permease protein n=1 Tax=Actinocorallia longicatena TaxID=111803 RepID=A0ABP6QMP2_9ACTN